MSFATAVAEIQTQLVTAGLAEYADPRVESLANVGGGVLDGVYLLRPVSFRPWPEASKDARLMMATLELEVCTLLHTDELTQVATMSSRAKAVRDNTQYTSLTNGCVVNAQPADFKRIGKDRRLLWVWRFDLRYTET